MRRAERFVRDESGFAQVTTLDRHGYPVSRSMTAFLAQEWVVDLVQRASHARLAQLRRDPRLLVSWVGPPAADATDAYPHVFDLGRLPQRTVMVRGTATFMDVEWTWATYAAQSARHRGRGDDRAPVRDAAQVATDLVGVRVTPYRVRLEGFGDGAQSFDWVLGTPWQPSQQLGAPGPQTTTGGER